MLISPNWQTVWMESQHCSKSVMNATLSSQKAEKVLEDLITQCCSPNKAVQLAALKCWGMWIHSQKPEDWKLNTICFAAVRPLIPKKLQPLHKDVDICTLKLSLMWALLVKVQSTIHLEGPQYILEVFLQSCLTWLSSAGDDGCENEVSNLIFKLLLGLINKDETISGIDRKIFPPLTANVLHSKKFFHRLAEKFLTVFVYWRKVQEKAVILKLWKHFLEHCELSCDHIPVPVWHKIFKLAGQICSEKSEPVKERLAFLHGCATTLKSAVSSSKFIDFGNLLTTPCEAFLKKLVELCCAVESDECSDLEMFYHSKEICQVLSVRSVALGGYVLCISVLDVLEEFWLRDLFWGVWCGLVCCYKNQLLEIDKSQFTKVQTKFYRKLRGAAVNFELDRSKLHKDCISEVEKHIGVLNISCMCTSHLTEKADDCSVRETSLELMDVDSHSQEFSKSVVIQTPPEEHSKQIACRLPSPLFFGKFSTVALCSRVAPGKAVNLNFDLIKNIFHNFSINFPKSLLSYSFTIRFIEPQRVDLDEPVRILNGCSLQIKPALENMKKTNLPVPCLASTTPPPVPARTRKEKSKRTSCALQNKEEVEEETISTPLTRSRRKAEEEKQRESGRLTGKKRKSFEVVVQEILMKNKERKTEKNCRKKKTESQKAKRNKRKVRKSEEENSNPTVPETEVSGRKLRSSKKEEPKKELKRTDGKLENYFKVLSKKTKKEEKKEEKRPQKKKKAKKERRESVCCKPEKEEGERKSETGWRQTSLKSMMTEKSQIRGRLRARKKVAEGGNKTSICPLLNLSPFKEVLHDHEYVKIDPHKFIHATQEKKVERSEMEEEKATEPELNKNENSENEVESGCEKLETESSECPEVKVPGPEEPNLPEAEMLYEDNTVQGNKKEEQITDSQVELENAPDVKIIEETPVRRGIKRTRICEDHIPNKRIKREMEDDDQEEKLPLEITEKENMEERQQPPREKPEFSPLKTMSRALRMIALVPESTKGGQVQREASPRVELFKCKKGPNVDRSSRASKMLALLSENVVEVEDASEVEDLSSWGGLTSTPKKKTAASSLKSPKSLKKGKSIRFDDAKNETVLYQTDTPPSQILQAKEKCRRIKLA